MGKNFQIRLKDMYIGFTSLEQNAESIALEKANQHIKELIDKGITDIAKTVSVIEYDFKKDKAVKNGLKFKLRLEKININCKLFDFTNYKYFL